MYTRFEKQCHQFIEWFESLKPETSTLEALREYYAEDVTFKSPLHQARGIEEYAKLYSLWFDKYPGLKFKLTDYVMDDTKRVLFCHWTLTYHDNNGGKTKQLCGMGYTRFNKELKVDYDEALFDAKVVYEDIPILGWFLKLIRDAFLK